MPLYGPIVIFEAKDLASKTSPCYSALAMTQLVSQAYLERLFSHLDC